MEDTRKRVIACFESVSIFFRLIQRQYLLRHRAAALASGCKVNVTVGSVGNEIRQNKALGMKVRGAGAWC